MELIIIMVMALILVLWRTFQSPQPCPECGEYLARFRAPRSIRETMWGSVVCANCGCEVNWRGRKMSFLSYSRKRKPPHGEG